MATDYEHALFVLSEYRYETEKSEGIFAENENASEIEIDTSLEEAEAQALAVKILADNVKPRLHQVDIEGLLWLNKFIGGPPSWAVTLDHDAVSGQTHKTISTTVEFSAGISTVEVRG